MCGYSIFKTIILSLSISLSDAHAPTSTHTQRNANHISSKRYKMAYVYNIYTKFNFITELKLLTTI